MQNCDCTYTLSMQHLCCHSLTSFLEIRSLPDFVMGTYSSPQKDAPNVTWELGGIFGFEDYYWEFYRFITDYVKTRLYI